MCIINIFDSKDDLEKEYPKKYYWSLKDIFDDHWEEFLDFADARHLTIRDVVINNVEKMRMCGTSALGYSVYKCPCCGEEKVVYNTCKSRFCNSCGLKYSKERATYIKSKLITGKHRHLVFTIPDFLWPLFLEDRTRLNFMFQATSITLNSWYRGQCKGKKLTPGFILFLHTFGRDDKWNVHIHCILSEYALGKKIKKKIDFIPFPMLRKRFQKILMDLLEKNIGKEKFRPTKNKVYQNCKEGFYVYAKKVKHMSTKETIEYVLRYCGRPCFAQYRIIGIDKDNFISFWYQRHEDDKFVVERIHIFEFISRLIRHIPEEQFKTIRYYGFYSAHKHEEYNNCRKVIEAIQLPFHKSLNTYRALSIKSFSVDSLMCPKCRLLMKFIKRYPGNYEN